jgi:uncharacterized protein YndB with AHSA1/START domain
MSATSPDGTIEERDGKRILRFERRLEHPVDRVWAALTEPSELVGWLAEAELERREGGPIVLRWLNSDEEGNQAVLHGTITRLEPPRLIEYEGDIHGLLRWELREEGSGCVLTFINETPAPDDFIPMAAAGWHIHLDHLDAALAGRPVDWPRWDRDHLPAWAALRDRYAAAYDRER